MLSPEEIISLVSVCIVAISVAITAWHNNKADTESDAERITKIGTQLDSIATMQADLKKDISEMKSELKADMLSMKADMKADHDKLIKTEQSVKSVWHEVNNLRGLPADKKEDSNNENE